MLETYQEYLESPSQSHFLQLQQEVIAEADFDPQGAIVFRLEQLCQANDFDAAYKLTSEMPLAWVTSPSLHFFASMAAEKMGQTSEAETEAFLIESMFQGLLSTGNGTLEHPYLITQLTDQHDILSFKSLQKVSQRLIGTAAGTMDAITCDDHSTLHFDLSIIMSKGFTASKNHLGHLAKPSSRFRPLLARDRLGF
ncbi:MAG: hypothetical protein COA78_08320 [Blastopirellula sp.]|nr:MAG: hypothetical protein COA78_08320 [Blastopirellula sp.]